MKNPINILFLLAISFLCFSCGGDGGGSSASSPQDYYIKVTNRTGYQIAVIQVSPESSSSWEEDVLGSSYLDNGDTFRLDLTGYSSPIFDVRCIDEDGDSYTFWGINVAQKDLIVQISDLD